ncbi:MAG: PAS domain-containing protein [Pirellulales bacterium]
MLNWLTGLFETEGVPARWNCGSLWENEPWWGWTHIVADVAIWAAYTAIPLVLLYFVRKRRDTPFLRVFWLFGAFIFACGTTHLIDASLFWWPAYRLAGVLKIITATVSWATVMALIPVVPQALGLRGVIQLERSVRERTHELADLNERLSAETMLARSATAALKLNEEKLTLALDIGRLGVWEWEFASNEIRLDACAAAMWGFDECSTIVPADLVLDRIHPDDRATVQNRIETTRALRERYQGEFRILQPRTGLRWLEGCGETQFDDEGKPCRMVGLYGDITDRRTSEEDLRLSSRALEAATNGVVMTNAASAENEIVYVSRGFEFLTGYSRDEVIGKNCRFLQTAETDPATRKKLRDAIAAKQSCEVVILNARRRNDLLERSPFEPFEERTRRGHALRRHSERRHRANELRVVVAGRAKPSRIGQPGQERVSSEYES